MKHFLLAYFIFCTFSFNYDLKLDRYGQPHTRTQEYINFRLIWQSKNKGYYTFLNENKYRKFPKEKAESKSCACAMCMCGLACVYVCGRPYAKASNGRHNLRSFRLAKNLILIYAAIGFTWRTFLQSVEFISKGNSLEAIDIFTLLPIDFHSFHTVVSLFRARGRRGRQV